MTYKSTRIFVKVTNENLSAFPEMTRNHEFYGPKKVDNDVKERLEVERIDIEREKREKEYVAFCLYIGK